MLLYLSAKKSIYRTDGQNYKKDLKMRKILELNLYLSLFSFSFFLFQLPLLPFWLSLWFSFGWIPMPLNRLHPAFSLSVSASFILSSSKGKSRINCILSSPLTDIARSFTLMGDRWQRIVVIFKGPHCLSQWCLWKRWQPRVSAYTLSRLEYLWLVCRVGCVTVNALGKPCVAPANVSLFTAHNSLRISTGQFLIGKTWRGAQGWI